MLEQALSEFRKLQPALAQVQPNQVLNTNPEHVEKVYASARRLLALGYGAQQLKGRGDKEFIQHQQNIMDVPELKGTPARLIADWQTIPVFQFSNGEGNMDTWDCEINLPDGMTRSDFGLQAISGAFDNLPFEKFGFVIYDVLSNSKVFAYVFAKNEGTVSIVGFYYNVYNASITARPIVFRRNDQGFYEAKGHDTLAAFIGNSVSCCAAYLQQTHKRAVEVSAENPRIIKGSKTARKKPWLRDDLPHIIMIDPTQARERGQTGAVTSERQSPVPHARRGHWRRLKANEKREREAHVFVRPAWIGPGAWKNEGKIYRIVRDKKEEE